MTERRGVLFADATDIFVFWGGIARPRPTRGADPGWSVPGSPCSCPSKVKRDVWPRARRQLWRCVSGFAARAGSRRHVRAHRGAVGSPETWKCS